MSIRTALLPKQNVCKYFYLLQFNLLRITFKPVLNRTLDISVLQIHNISCSVSSGILIVSCLVSGVRVIEIA